MTVRDSCFGGAPGPDEAELFPRHSSWPISSGYRSRITSRRCYQPAMGHLVPHGRARSSYFLSRAGYS